MAISFADLQSTTLSLTILRNAIQVARQRDITASQVSLDIYDFYGSQSPYEVENDQTALLQKADTALFTYGH